jgi:hypothetical protein
MWFKKELFIRGIKFEASWLAISVRKLGKVMDQGAIHFRYPKLNLMSPLSESVRQMDSGDTFTTDIAEWLHISNVKESYRSANNVNYIGQMFKHNDQSTGLDYTEERL